MLTLRIVASLAVLAAASAAQAAYVISNTPVDIDISKASGGSTFANGMLLNGMSRSDAAQFAAYKELKFDVQASTTTWAADANFGVAWNTDSTGGWSYSGLGEQWLWSGWQGTITYDYSVNSAFQTSVAAYASGNGTWWQFFGESNWPGYGGTNHYTVTQVYLDSPVPEPTMLSVAAIVGMGLLKRRHR